MDELFEGYMEMDDAVAGFLVNRGPITKRPDTVPYAEQHVQSTAKVTHPLTSDVNRHTQCLAVSGPDTTAPGGSRQRRGHTKSRLGCIGCKRRKIKCQETWPSCANCNKRGLVCRYPDVFKHAHRDEMLSEVPSPRQITKLSDSPTIYTSDDMQLFHHYITIAYPCIPHDYEDIWRRVVPTHSHQHSYLMDAMLALAGSHLGIQVENPKVSLALQHRQKAIVGLEHAFTKWPPTAGEAHIMLATSYLLSFQSSYMEDGFLEHILSLRGCSLLSQLILSEGLGGPFAVNMGLDSVVMDMAFRDFPEIDQELACEALLSLAGLKNLLEGEETQLIEKALVTQLIETLRCLLCGGKESTDGEETPDLMPTCFADPIMDMDSGKSPSSTSTTPYGCLAFINPLFPAGLDVTFHDIDWENITTPPLREPDPLESFKALMATLTILATWDHASLIRLFDSTNQVGNIVMAHFCAVRFVVSPLSAPKNAMTTPTKAVVEWMSRIIAAVDEGEGEWGMYVEWPRKILKCMQRNVERKRGFTMGDVRDMLLHDPGAFKEGRARNF